MGEGACILVLEELEAARMSGMIADSVPPARTTSAWPRRIEAAASPIAVEPVAHAETGAKFVPRSPSWIAI